MILNTPSLCNNITSRANLDIKDAHSPKKKKKGKNTSPKNAETHDSQSTTSGDNT
jgi:hypothetical protein